MGRKRLDRGWCRVLQAMDLKLHQLDRRYEGLRTHSARRERRLLASLSEVGQQTPIVVVRDGQRWVVVDGYKRVRAVQRLGQDRSSRGRVSHPRRRRFPR